MENLTFPRDTFDQDVTFKVEYKGHKGRPHFITAYLFNDEEGGKIYIMQKSACLKSHYTDKDREEQDRLRKQTAVKDGDTVTVNGETYKVKILGNYSDAGYLVKV